MRHLVVCCDGTWNTPEQQQGGVPAPTNVVRLFNALEKNDAQQCYYHPGVGTGPGVVDHLAGGSVGSGLSANVKSAYAWLAATYVPGDAICLVGFSRGAFTVRSLAGMTGICGLVEIPADSDPTERWAAIDHLFDDVYRAQGTAVGREVPIAFLGVWDTVGALGIPESLGLLRLADDVLGHPPRFHDTKLGEHVQHARHAVALDERRGPFVPTLWSNLPVPEGRTARQVWFPGDHCDVGGGHQQTGLSDGALRWMIGEAVAVCPGLAFREAVVEQIAPMPGDVQHDAAVGVYGLMGPTPRAAPFLSAERRDADVHESAYQRQERFPIAVGPYRDGRVLADRESVDLDVFAAQPWNWTGLYLDVGEYTLTAAGHWLDRSAAHDPDGTRDGGHHLPNLLHVLGSAIGDLEVALRSVTGDKALAFLGALRLPEAPWMALSGPSRRRTSTRRRPNARTDSS